MDEDKVDITLAIDGNTFEGLYHIVEVGYLGTTIEAVIAHILRQYLWETRK